VFDKKTTDMLRKKERRASKEVRLILQQIEDDPIDYLLDPENAAKYGRAMGIRDTLRELLYPNKD